MTFGEKLKDLRIGRRMRLRDCSSALEIDTSNWSKFERGVSPAPRDIQILEAWALFFQLDGEEKQEFFDLAALSRRQLPDDLASDEALMAKLPAFFRVVRGKELEGQNLNDFINDLRKVHRRHESERE